jgi:hypothetical protein
MINKGSSELWINRYSFLNTANYSVDKTVEKFAGGLWTIVDKFGRGCQNQAYPQYFNVVLFTCSQASL